MDNPPALSPPAAPASKHPGATLPEAPQPTPRSSWYRLDGHPRIALILMLTMAVLSFVTVRASYEANGSYWQVYFGEHGPVAESTLPVILMLFTFWIRHILFPRTILNFSVDQAGTSDSRHIGKSYDEAGNHRVPLLFKPETRSPKAFWLFLIFLFAPLMVLYLLTTALTYRWETPIIYYLGWTGPFACMCAWAWEVIWAVGSSYNTRRLREQVVEISQLYSLYEQLHDNTQNLIWSLGTFMFFVVGFFGKFYISLVTVLYSGAFLLLIFISGYPWVKAYQRAQELIDAETSELDELVLEKMHQKYQASFGDDVWIRNNTELELLRDELTAMKDLLSNFSFSKWLEERRTDLVPVTALNILGPYVTSPLFQMLQAHLAK